jgi:hypothetical protein
MLLWGRSRSSSSSRLFVNARGSWLPKRKINTLAKSSPPASAEAGGYENSSCTGILLRWWVELAASVESRGLTGWDSGGGGLFLRPPLYTTEPLGCSESLGFGGAGDRTLGNSAYIVTMLNRPPGQFPDTALVRVPADSLPRRSLDHFANTTHLMSG